MRYHGDNAAGKEGEMKNVTLMSSGIRTLPALLAIHMSSILVDSIR